MQPRAGDLSIRVGVCHWLGCGYRLGGGTSSQEARGCSPTLLIRTTRLQ